MPAPLELDVRDDGHLDEVAVEALVHGRADLVPDDARLHAMRCASCREALDGARHQSAAAATMFASLEEEGPLPSPATLESMVEQALGTTSRPPLRAFFAGTVVALTTGVAALWVRSPTLPSWSGALDGAGRVLKAIVRLDGLVREVVPGAYGGLSIALFAMALGCLFGLARTLRRVGVVAVIPLLLALGISGSPGAARALDVEGEFGDLPRVDLVVDDEPAGVVLARLAEAAGLDLVATDVPATRVTLRVRDASVEELLRSLPLAVSVVAARRGSKLVVGPRDAVTAAAPPPSAVPDRRGRVSDVPAAAVPGEGTPGASATSPRRNRVKASSLRDVRTFGGDVRIAEGDRVADVLTMGGDATIVGEVVGDVVSFGGDVRIEGVVLGDVASMGGDVEIAEDAVVEGSIATMGGELRDERSGTWRASSTSRSAGAAEVNVHRDDDDDEPRWMATLGDVLASAVGYALLYLFGLVVFAVAPSRIKTAVRSLAQRPIHSLFLGVLGLFGSACCALLLTVTIVGIPLALVVLSAASLATALGLVAVATLLGRVFPAPPLDGRPFLRLALGVGLLFLVSLIPVLSSLFLGLALVTGFGAALDAFSRPRGA